MNNLFYYYIMDKEDKKRKVIDALSQQTDPFDPFTFAMILNNLDIDEDFFDEDEWEEILEEVENAVE